MDPLYWLSLLIIIAFYFSTRYIIKKIKWHKRKKAFESDFPQEWEEVLLKDFPLYSKLSVELQLQLKGHIQIFLSEKNFVGYQGVEINDQIRVVIAANACLLILNRKTNYYPYLHNILVYPSHFRHHSDENVDKSRLGESWLKGPLVLSWLHSQSGAMNSSDGNNVILHEFAHQLDQENGIADGLPILRHNKLRNWSRVFNKEYNSLIKIYENGRKTFIDEYGSTNPAEFFAVVTEHFFEEAKLMRRKHPELYSELVTYYQVDPGKWEIAHN